MANTTALTGIEPAVLRHRASVFSCGGRARVARKRAARIAP